jgi:hypothetical protein
MNRVNILEQMQEMREEVDLMRDLATRSGFFKRYFKELGRKESGKSVHRTNLECFHYLNQIYFSLFGEEKYSTYNSFQNSYNNYLKSR